MESGLPECRLRRHPRRSAHAQGRDPHARRQKLSAQRGAGTSGAQRQIPRREKAEESLRARSMEPHDLPIVCIPLELPDEAAAELLEFLRNLTETLERHYFGQLHRLAQARHAPTRDLDYPAVRPESDPTF